MKQGNASQQPIWDGQARWRQLLGLALLAGLLLRIAFLGHKSLWLDEGMSLQVAQAGQEALWQGISVKDHPPFYFWLLGAWLRLGEGEAHLRLLSVVAGVAAIPLAFGLARVLFSRPVAVTAAWLIALSPLLIWYSQEIRNYSQLVCCGLGATYVLAQLWLDRRGSQGYAGLSAVWWALYVLFMTAAFYTHYMAVLLIAVQAILFAGLWASGRVQMRLIWLWLTGMGAVLLAYVPWLRTPAAGHFVALLGQNSLYPARLLSATLGMGDSHLQAVLGFGLLLALVVGLVVTFLLFRKWRDVWAEWRSSHWFQIGLVALYVGVLVISVLPRGYTLKRQLLVLAPYPLIGLAWFWPWRPPFGKLLTIILAVSLVASAACLAVPKDQWRETVRHIHENATPSDVVLLLPSYMTIPFDYYNRDQVARRGISPANAPEILQALHDRHARIWLISHTADIADPDHRVQTWLDSHARLVDERSFYRLEVRLYDE